MRPTLYSDLSRQFTQPPNAVSRRRMLQATAAAGAALLLSSAALGRARPARTRHTVIVVGGGLSGLACALELRAAGYDVHILEARDRCGGRVLTWCDSEQNAFISGRTLEAGGEFIGESHALCHAYAERAKVELVPVKRPEAPAAVFIAGTRLSEEDTRRLWQDMSTAFAGLSTLAEPIDADKPWTSARAEELDKRTVQSWIDALEGPELLKKACRESLLADIGVDPETASLLGLLARVKAGGLEKYWSSVERYRCKGGNILLAAGIMNLFGFEDMTPSTPIARIALGPRGVALESTEGFTFEAEDVVLAVPPSVYNQIRFEPALPPSVEVQMGISAKYLAYLSRRFWSESKSGANTLSDGPVQRTWDATAEQPGNSDVCLAAFTAGPRASRLLNTAPDALDEEVSRHIAPMFPEYPVNFVASRMQDWSRDAWSRGSSAFPAPGQVTRAGPALEHGAFEAAGVSRLHFAGDHACTRYAGTMEGALQAGVAVAKRLAARDGPPK